MTINYYSPCPQPELALGLQSHSDMGVISLLIQDDVGGLEVLKDGEWILAKPSSDAIIVILADQTETRCAGSHLAGRSKGSPVGKRLAFGILRFSHFYDTPSRARPQVDPLRRLPSSWQVRRLACGGKVGFWDTLV
ncbi:Flavonol synthase/flavanone 3-hydroxylase [Platanthera zijinensis]|uniref:Flavonol synthase/flavanone 3-hydroxylase n=1 Tax=Platanthera zijinensis TaxID=2320716 RepID=A0AAP0G9D8_9ASPA